MTFADLLREFEQRAGVTTYWCPGCGIVCQGHSAPICRHNVGSSTMAHPPRRCEPLPPWHPYAAGLSKENT